MSAADVSAIVDLAGVPESPSTPEPTTPEVTPEPITPETPTPESTEPEQPQADSDAEPQADVATAPEPSVDGRTNPAAIRSALKAFRDSDPKNAGLARELNDGYGRYLAYKEAFGTVADARNVKAFIDANGGVEGLTSLHETIKNVNDTDALLYAGDPKVLDNIIEDMRRENKLDAFSKLGGPFLEKLRGLNEKAYFETLKPHFYQGLVDTGVPNVVQQIAKLLGAATPDVEGAKGLLTEFSNWLNGLRDSVERSDRSKLDPDRQAFEAERQEFRNQQTKEFQNSVAAAADEHNNQALGGALKPFFKLPFFKNLVGNREALLDLASGVKARLLNELKADKTYQSQMDAFFAQKSPDKAKISQYHNARVDGMAQRIVKQVIETRYPDYAKRGPITKPASPAAPKPSAGVPQPGRPEYIKSKPDSNDIDWDKTDRLSFIAGRVHLKNGKYVAWGKNNEKFK